MSVHHHGTDGSLILHGQDHEAATSGVHHIGQAFQDILLAVAELVQVIFQESGDVIVGVCRMFSPVAGSCTMYSIQWVVW